MNPNNRNYACWPPHIPFYWNRVIPAVYDDAVTYDAMMMKLIYTVNEIIKNQYLTVPYLIMTVATSTPSTVKIVGEFWQDYEKITVNQEFTMTGFADGTYYINVYNDSMNKVVGDQISPDGVVYVSQDFMPMNCTTLYSFQVSGGSVVADSLKYNDLYTGMHDADMNAHKELFDAVNASIDKEIQDRISGDANLQNQVNANDQDIAKLQADLSKEITDRTNADTDVRNDLTTAINSEKDARIAADTAIETQVTTNKNTMDAHIANQSNPHNVTKAQIGLSDVPNGPFVNSLNSLSGDVQIAAGEGITVTNMANNIQIAATGSGSSGVNSINSEQGDITIEGGTGIQVNTSAGRIQIASTGGSSQDGVNSFNGQKGDITLVSGDNITMEQAGTQFTLNANVVSSINTLIGALTLTGGNGITVQPNGPGKSISIANTFPPIYAEPTTVQLTGQGSLSILTHSALSLTNGTRKWIYLNGMSATGVPTVSANQQMLTLPTGYTFTYNVWIPIYIYNSSAGMFTVVGASCAANSNTLRADLATASSVSPTAWRIPPYFIEVTQ